MSRLSQPRFGLDYAWTTISPSAHKAVGSNFACRYVSTDDSKDISAGEAHVLRSNGIDVVSVWETTANRALDGHGAGASDAQAARAKSQAAGQPGGRPIFFAVDFDPAGNAGATDSYFDGVASVLGKGACGPYGGIEVVSRQFDRGFAYGWQTYAWSGGRLDTRTQIYQYSNDHVVGGSGCDFNHAFFEDFGQWDFNPPAPPDPYANFPTEPRLLLGKKLNENWEVRQWDKNWPYRNKHKGYERLAQLYPELKALRDRIWFVAHYDRINGNWIAKRQADWYTGHRNFRWHAINDRLNAFKKVRPV